MRLILTGASSFVGAHLATLAASRHEVIGLAHQAKLQIPGVRTLQLDLSDPASLAPLRALRADAVLHLACKVMGSGGANGAPTALLNRQMMDRVLALELPVLYASSTCVHWPRDTGYARSRREDELRLALSGLPFATLRPCAPYGPPLATHQPRHKESFHSLVAMVRRWPVVPMLGDGRALRQPIHVADFAEAALRLLEVGLPNRALDAGGPEALSFREIVGELGRQLGRPARLLPVPVRLIAKMARFNPNMEPELLLAGACDDTADPAELSAVTGLRPRPFAEGARDLIG